MIRSGNPALKGNVFANIRSADPADVMSIQGTANKTLILLIVAFFTASWIWSDPVRLMPLTWIGLIGGLITAMVTIFKKEIAHITAPIYAALEGLFLGGISSMFELSYPGIVIQAVALTFGVLFCLLMAYKSRLIKVTENFKLGIVAATGGICCIYFLSFIMSFFGTRIPFIHEGGIIGIGFSLFVVVIASLNLVLDFDFIEKGADYGAPKYMEWFGAFALMVTLVWLYIEILSLLAKTRRR